MTADGKPPMNYETYILPHELPRVVPRERHVDPLRGDPDEEFFIRTHQALEIWFAQLLAELAHARRLLAQPAPYYVPESDVPAMVKHVRRAARIFDLIRQHLPVLETLDTTSFYNFRKHLFGASGTQSFRFREVEWLMGMLDKDLLRYTKQKPAGGGEEHAALAAYQAQWDASWDRRRKRFDPGAFPHMPETAAALARRRVDIGNNGTLRTHAMKWLARTTFPAPRGAPDARHSALFAQKFEQVYLAAHAADTRRLAELQDMEKGEIRRITAEARRRTRYFLREPSRRAIVFLLQFADQPLLTWPASFVEALLELEQAFANWRDRHIAMVARVLGGGRISTLGAAGSGLSYLRGTLPKRVFPEIWDARTFMLSHDEAAGIYTPRQLSPYGFLHEKRPDRPR